MNENPTDAKEQYELGEKLLYVKGVSWDRDKAVVWYTKAAEQGYADAQYRLGECYHHGSYVLKNLEKAGYWYTKAAGQFTIAANQGDAHACYRLYQIYGDILCEWQDIKKARHWLFRAAELGNAEAQCSLAFHFSGVSSTSNFLSIFKDKKKEAYWYAEAAKQGYARAQNSLGDSYAYGNGVPKDLEKAVYWYTKAAEQDNEYAQYRLGCSYAYGYGIPKDLEKAKHWIFLAAEQGNKDAKNALDRLNAGKSLGGCYVATCVYGSYDCPEVWTLRRFRDNILSDSWFGRWFIRIYYAVSPKIVELFGNSKWFRRLWKPIINEIVCKLQNSGIDSSPYSDTIQTIKEKHLEKNFSFWLAQCSLLAGLSDVPLSEPRLTGCKD